MPKAATAKKSVVKSVEKAPERVVPQPHGGAVRPFQRGHDSRRGKGPAKGAPNAGRPSNDIVDKAVKLYGAKALPLLEDIIDGKPMEKMLGPDGEETEFLVSARAETRIKAIAEVSKVARLTGAKIDVEHTLGRPTLNIIEQVIGKLP